MDVLVNVQCTNLQMIEFAFAKLGPDLIGSMLTVWEQTAWTMNNIVLWNYVRSKNITHESTYRIEDAGTKPSEFITSLWPTHNQYFIAMADSLFKSALKANNEPVLQFLATKDEFVIDNKVLCSSLKNLASLGLNAFICKIQDPKKISDRKRSLAFLAARDKTVAQTLLNKFQNLPPNRDSFSSLLSTQSLNKEQHFELCAFFVQKKFITLRSLYEIFMANKDETIDMESKINMDLVDMFVARFYADF